MSNRIPTKSATFYVDSRHRDKDEQRIARNARRNERARKVTFLADGVTPWFVRLMDSNRAKHRRIRLAHALGRTP